MHMYKGEKPREEKEKRKERELVNVARDIFGRQTHITYIDLCEQLQQVLDVKERTAKSYIRFIVGTLYKVGDSVNDDQLDATVLVVELSMLCTMAFRRSLRDIPVRQNAFSSSGLSGCWARASRLLTFLNSCTSDCSVS